MINGDDVPMVFGMVIGMLVMFFLGIACGVSHERDNNDEKMQHAYCRAISNDSIKKFEDCEQGKYGKYFYVYEERGKK